MEAPQPLESAVPPAPGTPPVVKQRRKQIRRACQRCHETKVRCSEVRPCVRCVDRGLSCIENPNWKRRTVSTKPKKFKIIDATKVVENNASQCATVVATSPSTPPPHSSPLMHALLEAVQSKSVQIKKKGPTKCKHSPSPSPPASESFLLTLQAAAAAPDSTPATPDRSPESMTKEAQEVCKFLNGLLLARYFGTFMQQGLDQMETVLELKETELEKMAILPGHRKLIMDRIQQINSGANSPASPSSPSSPTAPDMSSQESDLSSSPLLTGKSISTTYYFEVYSDSEDDENDDDDEAELVSDIVEMWNANVYGYPADLSPESDSSELPSPPSPLALPPPHAQTSVL